MSNLKNTWILFFSRNKFIPKSYKNTSFFFLHFFLDQRPKTQENKHHNHNMNSNRTEQQPQREQWLPNLHKSEPNPTLKPNGTAEPKHHTTEPKHFRTGTQQQQRANGTSKEKKERGSFLKKIRTFDCRSSLLVKFFLKTNDRMWKRRKRRNF